MSSTFVGLHPVSSYIFEGQYSSSVTLSIGAGSFSSSEHAQSNKAIVEMANNIFFILL